MFYSSISVPLREQVLLVEWRPNSRDWVLAFNLAPLRSDEIGLFSTPAMSMHQYHPFQHVSDYNAIRQDKKIKNIREGINKNTFATDDMIVYV